MNYNGNGQKILIEKLLFAC